MQQTQSITSDYKRSLLDSLRLFKGVYPDDIQVLLQRCDRRDLAGGEVLLTPKERNEHVFVVLSGSLNVHVGSPDVPAVVTMEAGDCVGEMSIIEDRDPSAYVIAAEDSHLLVIHQSVLWKMVDASHDFAKNLLVVLSERVRSHNRVIASNYGKLRRIERHATTDALTNLANRHAMETAFPKLIEHCQSKAKPVSLMMIDVDNFKQFNDMLGHVAGDRALSIVARILRQQFRQRDLLRREEVAGLLAEAGSQADPSRRSAEQREHAALQVALEVHRDVVACAPEVGQEVVHLGGHAARGTEERTLPGLPGIDVKPVDVPVAPQQRRRPILDQKADERVRTRLPERRQAVQRVDDVSDRGEPDEQDAVGGVGGQKRTSDVQFVKQDMTSQVSYRAFGVRNLNESVSV